MWSLLSAQAGGVTVGDPGMTSLERAAALGLAIAAAPALIGGALADQRWVVTGGTVGFTATGWPGGLRIDGRGGAPKGEVHTEDAEVSGRIVFDLETLRTGIDLRDRHMRQKYLDTSAHRHSELALESLSLPPQGDGETDLELEDLSFTGRLRLRGVWRPVRGAASVRRRQSRVFVVATFIIETRSFGIQPPSFAGITLGEQVKVRVSLEAERP